MWDDRRGEVLTHTHTRTHLVNMLARGEADARLSPRRRRFHGDADDYMLVVGDYVDCRCEDKSRWILRMGS